MKLRVPQYVYDRRLERMAVLIAMKAPAIIIYHEARLIQEAYRPSFWNRLKWSVQQSHIGIWFSMLFYNPPELDDDGVSDADAMADDLTDPHFSQAFDPAQLARFMRDVTKSSTVSYDTEMNEQDKAPCGCPIRHDGQVLIHGEQCYLRQN